MNQVAEMLRVQEDQRPKTLTELLERITDTGITREKIVTAFDLFAADDQQIFDKLQRIGSEALARALGVPIEQVYFLKRVLSGMTA